MRKISGKVFIYVGMYILLFCTISLADKFDKDLGMTIAIISSIILIIIGAESLDTTK